MDPEEIKVVLPKNAAAFQRMKINKLMNNPDKPVNIPDRADPKLPKVFNPPEFIRNIWGSSAGAGSGDFHVYRGVRRREYARQKFTKMIEAKEVLDEEYLKKVEQNKVDADKRTSKKRAKRQKKKQNKKIKKPDDEIKKDSPESASSDEDEDENNESNENSVEKER